MALSGWAISELSLQTSRLNGSVGLVPLRSDNHKLNLDRQDVVVRNQIVTVMDRERQSPAEALSTLSRLHGQGSLSDDEFSSLEQEMVPSTETEQVGNTIATSRGSLFGIVVAAIALRIWTGSRVNLGMAVKARDLALGSPVDWTNPAHSNTRYALVTGYIVAAGKSLAKVGAPCGTIMNS